MQQVGPIFSHRVEQLGDIAVKQQHADRDGRYAVSDLTVGTDANRPTGLVERGPWPAQSDVHRVAAIGVDWANSANLLPLDAPSHQATIKNSALVDRQDDAIIRGSPAETVHEECNTEQPDQTKPSHKGGGGQGEADQRRRRGAKK